jgi:hypothetical protein
MLPRAVRKKFFRSRNRRERMATFRYVCIDCGEEWEQPNSSPYIAEECPSCEGLGLAEEEVEET